MDHLQKKLSSLEEKASIRVAINLCQENDFKEVAMCLEKPTYGGFIRGGVFESDPDQLSAWVKLQEAKVEEDDWSFHVFMLSSWRRDEEKVDRWDAAIDEQCQRLTEGCLPGSLKDGVHAWMNRIALEYLSYSQRQEVSCGVSRYFLMDVLTRGDWTEGGRLDEGKLAERLLRDERLTALQRYRMACVYCLHADIAQLWKGLTREEKQSISGDVDPRLPEGRHSLVLLWSHHMDRHREERVTGPERNRLWTCAARMAVYCGNRASLEACWNRLKESKRQQMVFEMALQSLRAWQRIHDKLNSYKNYRQVLTFSNPPRKDAIQHFNLPPYYTELMRFFLSEMDEERQLRFFKEAFRSSFTDSVMECFLDWPNQDDFLPTINRLWGIAPPDKYERCLLTLARKYSGGDEKENRYYDYRSLLRRLWEETPDEYKRYVLRDEESDGVEYQATKKGGKEVLLPRLLERSPFQGEDEALFKRVWRDLPQEERGPTMRSEVGESICSMLTQKEKLSFVNELLEESLPNEEIPGFKRQFILSDCGRELCLRKLSENREKFLEDFIDWSLELEAEKTQFKCYELIRGYDCLLACKSFLSKGEFTEVERMMNFCLLPDDEKKQLRVHFARYTCSFLLEDYAWERLDNILAWGFDAEEKIGDLKKTLFSDAGIETHFILVFVRRQWEEVEHFYKWFGLSPEEIKKLKKDTLFTPEVFERVDTMLSCSTNRLVAPMRWCVTDEEVLIDLQKEVEKQCFKEALNESVKKEKKQRLDCLVNEVLCGFRNEVQDKTSRQEAEDKLEKGSPEVREDESSPPRKRVKHVQVRRLRPA